VNIVFDFGNTSHKCALFDQGKLIYHEIKNQFSPSDITGLIEKFSPQNSLLSSVQEFNPEIESIFSSSTHYFYFTPQLPIPLINKYSTPETLGNDRLAGAVGAAFTFPHEPVLIIDAGTCIKYDFVNAAGEYRGGAISPGLNMRFQAMHNYTARLPLINPDMLKTNEDIRLTGDSTNNSLLAGGAKGALFEVEGFINAYEERYPGLNVILTGGDASFFELHLKRKIFALPQLVLLGLNIILEHNLKQT
jgi:type III pantothenate kinase